MVYVWTLIALALIGGGAFFLAKKLKRPADLMFFGICFLISAPIELWNIISTGWEYQPKFFGIKTSGAFAIGILVAQPLLHLALGYGFLTLRRWAFYLSLFYLSDTLTSTVLGFVTEGYGRIRTIFLFVLVPFLIYLLLRRSKFSR
ncbi:MAG TPA: hypothetical protein VIU33_06545 [Nitrospiria bacterium]